MWTTQRLNQRLIGADGRGGDMSQQGKDDVPGWWRGVFLGPSLIRRRCNLTSEAAPRTFGMGAKSLYG